MIKMVVVPEILYKFQMLPLTLSQTCFKTLKSLLSKCIWQNKKPRIAFAILRRGKKQGGLAGPDLIKYYIAVALAQVVEWAKEANEKRWVI